jgi:hypothetical protein
MKPVLIRPGLFRDRREAGRVLAEKLAAYANRPDVLVLVLALPRGGVPVAYEVARALGSRLGPRRGPVGHDSVPKNAAGRRRIWPVSLSWGMSWLTYDRPSGW